MWMSTMARPLWPMNGIEELLGRQKQIGGRSLRVQQPLERSANDRSSSTMKQCIACMSAGPQSLRAYCQKFRDPSIGPWSHTQERLSKGMRREEEQAKAAYSRSAFHGRVAGRCFMLKAARKATPSARPPKTAGGMPACSARRTSSATEETWVFCMTRPRWTLMVLLVVPRRGRFAC